MSNNGDYLEQGFTGNPHDHEWYEKAACADSTYSAEQQYGDASQQRSLIKRLCRSTEQCPVQLPCALEGLKEGVGSHGGVTERNFNKLRPKLQKLAGIVAVEAEMIRQQRIQDNNNPVCTVAPDNNKASAVLTG